MVVYQSCIGWLTHCHRGQAPSHIWASVGFRFVCGIGQQEAWKAPWHPAWRVQNCGGLPPMMVYQSCIGWLTHCHRGQALSHIWASVGFRFVCGLGQQEAWKAPWHPAWCVQNCGRGLAPDSGASVMYRLADTLPSAASPLPYLGLHYLKVSDVSVVCFPGDPGVGSSGSPQCLSRAAQSHPQSPHVPATRNTCRLLLQIGR